MEMKREEAVLLCVVLFSLCAYSTALLTANGVNFEVQALMDIKKSLNDPHGVLNWDENAVDPCGWTMVSCSHDNLVTSLAIPSQSLSGAISRSIGNLTHLMSVLLQDNNITGPIPPELGRLQKLTQIDLSNNLLTGEIPSSLAQLKSLQYLRLNNNSLKGAIPLALGNLTQLTFLDLSFNNLSGPVPRLLAKTFNVLGNPMICATGKAPDCNGTAPMALSFSLSNAQNPQPVAKPKSHKLALAFGSSLGCIALLILGFGFLLGWRYKHNKQIFFDNEQYREEVCLGNLRRFQFRELQIATHNFSNKYILGKGGYGNVYKGCLRDGSIVAVKRLKDGSNSGGELQFQTEVEMISLAVHRNLLRLYGFCITSTERLLVYPYMSNGSVASRLKGGWVGFFSYDTVCYVEQKKLPFSGAPKDDRNLADIHLGLYDDVIVFYHVDKKAYVIHWVRLDRHLSAKKAYDDGMKRLEELVSRVQDIDPPTLSPGCIDFCTRDFGRGIDKCNMTSEEYMKVVLQAKEHILAGDIFQIVLSQRFERRTYVDPFEVYRALRVVNPSPYMSYLQARGCIMVASSPEILTRVKKRTVVNRPLVGTTRRGKTRHEDEMLEMELLKDENNVQNILC